METLAHLPNLIQVSDSLWRGGQPTNRGFEQLHDRGIQRVINLRDEPSVVTEESHILRSFGIQYVSIPLSPFIAPTEFAVKRFLEAFEEQPDMPTFVHCLHGQDRTGVMVCIYRMHISAWRFEEAHKEMLACGFHTIFEKLESAAHKFAANAGAGPLSI